MQPSSETIMMLLLLMSIVITTTGGFSKYPLLHFLIEGLQKQPNIILHLSGQGRMGSARHLRLVKMAVRSCHCQGGLPPHCVEDPMYCIAKRCYCEGAEGKHFFFLNYFLNLLQYQN